MKENIQVASLFTHSCKHTYAYYYRTGALLNKAVKEVQGEFPHGSGGSSVGSTWEPWFCAAHGLFPGCPGTVPWLCFSKVILSFPFPSTKAKQNGTLHPLVPESGIVHVQAFLPNTWEQIWTLLRKPWRDLPFHSIGVRMGGSLPATVVYQSWGKADHRQQGRGKQVSTAWAAACASQSLGPGWLQNAPV